MDIPALPFMIETMNTSKAPSIADLVDEESILSAPETENGFELTLKDNRKVTLPKSFKGRTMNREEYAALILRGGKLGPFDFRTPGGREYEAKIDWDPEYTYRESRLGHPIGWLYILYPPYES